MKRKTKAVLTATAATAVLAAGTVFGMSNAEAQSITLHNNYGSDRVVTARDSGGNLRYVYPGETVAMGSSMRIYVATGTCDRYGSPLNGVSFGRVCATDTIPTNWVASKSLWVDVVPN